jgi:hypothetical protein
VIGQGVRRFQVERERPPLWYWRTARNEEVDLLVEHGARFVAIECKLAETPDDGALRGLKALQTYYGARAIEAGYVVCRTPAPYRFSDGKTRAVGVLDLRLCRTILAGRTGGQVLATPVLHQQHALDLVAGGDAIEELAARERERHRHRLHEARDGLVREHHLVALGRRRDHATAYRVVRLRALARAAGDEKCRRDERHQRRGECARRAATGHVADPAASSTASTKPRKAKSPSS